MSAINIIYKDKKFEDIEAIFFDKDGTIIDSHLYWGKITENRANDLINYFNIDSGEFSNICKSIGYSVSLKKLLQKGPTGIKSREEVIIKVINKLRKIGIITNFDEINQIFKKTHTEFQRNMLDYIKIIPEAFNLINILKSKKIKLALITSDSINNTNLILKHLCLDTEFDIVIGKESCNKAKSSGLPSILALKELGVSALKTVAIGDAPMDKYMAINSGLKGVILVSTGQIKFPKLEKESDIVVPSLNELVIEDY